MGSKGCAGKYTGKVDLDGHGPGCDCYPCQFDRDEAPDLPLIVAAPVKVYPRVTPLQIRPVEHTCDGSNRTRCPCTRARARERWLAARAANPYKGRDVYRFRRYGLTREDYEALRAAQDHRCAVCRRPEGGSQRPPASRARRRPLPQEQADQGAGLSPMQRGSGVLPGRPRTLARRGGLPGGSEQGVGAGPARLLSHRPTQRPRIDTRGLLVRPGHVADIVEQPPAGAVHMLQPHGDL